MLKELPAHSGTHVDAPSHFVDGYRQRGLGVESLDLNILNGTFTLPTHLSYYFASNLFQNNKYMNNVKRFSITKCFIIMPVVYLDEELLSCMQAHLTTGWS